MLTNLNILITFSLNIQHFPFLNMVRMALVVEQKAENLKVQSSLLTFNILEL
jgi:hypothetical protein